MSLTWQIRGGIKRLVHLLALVVAVCMAFGAQPAAAKPPLGKKWPAGQQVLMEKIDHSSYDDLLSKHVDHDGYVDYAAWQRSSGDRQALRNYLQQLSRASRRKPASRDARLAFWINAYNAVTIEGILQVYPTSSIRNHTARVFGYNIWKELPLRVGGGKYSLTQIENEILRKMNEPRIHFAIVCASIGCPTLRNEAYTADKVQQQLADNARDFFTRTKSFRFDARRGTMQVSSILDWYGADFGSSQVKRFTYLKPYLPQAAQSLATNPRTRVSYLDYDWNLNYRPKRSRTASRRK